MLNVIHGKTDPEIGLIRYCCELFSKKFALVWIQVFSFTNIFDPFGDHQIYLLRDITHFLFILTTQMDYLILWPQKPAAHVAVQPAC